MSDELTFRIRLPRGRNFVLDVDGSIPMTGVTAIAGPSGSGKTTLLRSLAGLEPAGQAQIACRGEVWSDDVAFQPPEARQLGYVFQEPRLFPHLSVAGNLAFGAKRRGDPSYQGIIEALDLGPLMDRQIDSLSGGEARRVALGRALAANPTLLLLDEPLTGLDNDKKRELLPYIGRAVAEAQVPAIYVTHSVREITALADRVFLMEAGRLTGAGPAPLRLRGRVVSVDGDTMQVSIGDQLIRVPTAAAVGECVGLGVPPDSLMISATHPGGADALAILPAEVCRGEGDGLTLDVAGQIVTVHRQARHIAGARLWLSLLAAYVRPEPDDSLDEDRESDQSASIHEIGSAR